ncbi:addiction module protein [Algibacter sp. 2305UL17-15]|uniref:addiction module protein n=1 Tax=Algibacter sp. 2305UL17-15 TaxID=3231268 RepID=UPI003458D438
MDIQAEKIELVKLLLETQKESVINKIKLLLKSENEDFDVTEAQKEELDNRLARMEKGDTKFYSWERVEQNLKQAL